MCGDPAHHVPGVCVCLYMLVIPLKIKYHFKGENTVRGRGEPVREDISKEVYLAVALASGQVKLRAQPSGTHCRGTDFSGSYLIRHSLSLLCVSI